MEQREFFFAVGGFFVGWITMWLLDVAFWRYGKFSYSQEPLGDAHEVWEGRLKAAHQRIRELEAQVNAPVQQEKEAKVEPPSATMNRDIALLRSDKAHLQKQLDSSREMILKLEEELRRERYFRSVQHRGGLIDTGT